MPHTADKTYLERECYHRRWTILMANPKYGTVSVIFGLILIFLGCLKWRRNRFINSLVNEDLVIFIVAYQTYAKFRQNGG